MLHAFYNTIFLKKKITTLKAKGQRFNEGEAGTQHVNLMFMQIRHIGNAETLKPSQKRPVIWSAGRSHL